MNIFRAVAKRRKTRQDDKNWGSDGNIDQSKSLATPGNQIHDQSKTFFLLNNYGMSFISYYVEIFKLQVEFFCITP